MKRKSKGIAYFLWIISICGWLGFHRFYLGKKKTAVVWIFTIGLCGIGLLYDLITLAKQVDKYNSLLSSKNKSKKVSIDTSTQKEETEKKETSTSTNPYTAYKPPVFDENNNRIDYESSGFSLIPKDGYCFITNDSKSYHTHLNCFKNWSKEYQDKFNGWTLLPIEKAKERGATHKCKFCDSLDLSPDDFLNKYYGGKQTFIARLKNNFDTESQTYISCLSLNELLKVNCDYDKSSLDEEAYYLSVMDDKYNTSLGYLNKTDINKLKKLIKDEEARLEGMKAIVYSIDTNDNDKYVVSIAILI